MVFLRANLASIGVKWSWEFHRCWKIGNFSKKCDKYLSHAVTRVTSCVTKSRTHRCISNTWIDSVMHADAKANYCNWVYYKYDRLYLRVFECMPTFPRRKKIGGCITLIIREVEIIFCKNHTSGDRIGTVSLRFYWLFCLRQSKNNS